MREFLARIVAVTVLSRAKSDPGELQLAISTHTMYAHLTRANATGLTVNLQHECARRGLRAPRLSTMDLFMDNSGALVCNWNCRPDHVRAQWNLPPLDANITSAEEDLSRHICWPLPEQFVAVFFSLHVSTPVRRPHVALLPSDFYTGLNDLADTLQTERFGNGLVLLNLPKSSFDNVKFDLLLQRAVSFMGSEDDYEIIQLGRLDTEQAPSPSTQRRLFALGPEQGVLEVEGVVINPEATLRPARYVKEVEAAVDAVRTRLPPSLSAVSPPFVAELHRVAPALPPVRANETADSRIRRIATVGIEFLLITALAVLLCLWLVGARRRKRSKSAHETWTRFDI